ncbi:MAG: hypothetical protein KGI08_09365 [Thaumarchaeota archaeon]|nr:hypothetical protein [Nitrososphaerota archaeon]
MAIITYNTETSINCIFSAIGNIEETKRKLAYILEDVPYHIVSEDES